MSQGDVSQFFGTQGFDPNSVKPSEDFEVLPPGKYPVIVEAAEVKLTKKGDGHYLELQLAVLDGPGKGRKLWDRLNISNPNNAAVEIALRTLSALVKAAIGDVQFTNTNQLLGQAVLASVKVDARGSNAIRTYTSYADVLSVQRQQQQAPPVQQQAPPVQQPQQQQPMNTAPPWGQPQ